MVDVAFGDGSTLTATDHHPFWDARTGVFTDAVNLHPGDRVREPSGRLLFVRMIHAHVEDVTAYNLTVEGIHTFYAGTTPVLVHNETCPVSVNDAGRFADLKGEVGDGLTAHHMPQDALGFAERSEGGAIVMTQVDHMLTRTYGARGAATKFAESGLPFRTVLARDIFDIRRIGQQQYGDPSYFNKGIQGLLIYYRKTGQL